MSAVGRRAAAVATRSTDISLNFQLKLEKKRVRFVDLFKKKSTGTETIPSAEIQHAKSSSSILPKAISLKLEPSVLEEASRTLHDKALPLRFVSQSNLTILPYNDRLVGTFIRNESSKTDSYPIESEKQKGVDNHRPEEEEHAKLDEQLRDLKEQLKFSGQRILDVDKEIDYYMERKKSCLDQGKRDMAEVFASKARIFIARKNELSQHSLKVLKRNFGSLMLQRLRYVSLPHHMTYLLHDFNEFSRHNEPGVFHYCTLLRGYGKVGMVESMELLFKEMQDQQLKPNPLCYAAMIDAWIEGDSLPKVKHWAKQMIAFVGYALESTVMDRLVAFFARKGKFMELREWLKYSNPEKCTLLPSTIGSIMSASFPAHVTMTERVDMILEWTDYKGYMKALSHVFHSGAMDAAIALLEHMKKKQIFAELDDISYKMLKISLQVANKDDLIKVLKQRQ